MPEAPLEADGLVRHRRPYPTESLFGYVLRLSEENGCRTPHVLLGMVGRKDFRGPALPLRKLARIAHREVSELQAIAYIDDGVRDRFRLLGHALPAFELRVNRPSLCPECVRSAGFIEAHWDLTLMTGCPVHRSPLLSLCPECHMQLSWLRPGQLECACGATFEQADGPILSESEVTLLNIIRSKILALPVPTADSTKIPAAELFALSLRSLLFLMRTLARFHLKVDTTRSCGDPRRIVEAAAHVLSSYPVNFHKLLWLVGTQHGRKRSGGFASGRFGSMYRALFQRSAGDPPQSTDFLGRAFLDFAMNQWGRGVDARLLRRIQETMPKRIVTLNEFRELYDLGQEETRRILAMKNIATTRICVGQTDRVLIDLQKLHEPPKVPGKVLSLPYAAATIGISARTLSRLRASGHFEVKYITRRKGYHERDIEQFIERLLALNPNTTKKPLPPDCFMLHHAMHRYQGVGERGASVIRALLSGELRVLGNVDGTVRGLFVSRAEFQQFAKNLRARWHGNARTASEVAKEIHCDTGCVPGLVAARLLDGRKTTTGLRISEMSIARFKEKYVPLVSMARENGSSTRALMRHCAVKHVHMVVMKTMKTKQAFIRIEDRDTVLSFKPGVKRRYLGPSLFPDLEPVEQLPKQTSKPATPRVKRRDLGPSLFPGLEPGEQTRKRTSRPAA
jgi:hypothetical protein